MSNYIKATDFAGKDALLSGDPNKIIKGTEINDEFANIQTAVNSKADIVSPSFGGTPLAPTAAVNTNTTQVATTAYVMAERTNTATLTNKTIDAPTITGVGVAPTASFGTNTTQLATTAFVQAALQAVYPVGSIYISTTATNPNSTFGFGTWSEFGAGRVLVGQNSADASFDTLEEVGGSKDAIVVSHTHSFSGSGSTGAAGGHSHTFSGTTSSNGAHQHMNGAPIDCTSAQYPYGSQAGNQTSYFCDSNGTGGTNALTSSAGDHSHTYSGTTSGVGDHSHSVSVSGTNASTGSSGTNANLQPYVVVKMWKRTA